MATSRDTLAGIRYGMGLAPGRRPPAGAEALLAQLGAPAAGGLPGMSGLGERAAVIAQFRASREAVRAGAADAEDQRNAARAATRALALADQRLIGRH